MTLSFGDKMMRSEEGALSAASELPTHWAIAPGVVEAPRKGWQRQLVAVAEVVFAGSCGRPAPERLNWTVGEVADILHRVGGKGAFVYRLSVWMVAWIAPLYVWSLPSFRRLSFEKRVAALERFEHSVFGMMVFAIKALLCIVYFEHADAARELNFDGRCLGGQHDA